jgi:hypothetical protein
VMGQQNMMMFMDFPYYSHPKKDQKRVSRTYFQVYSIYFGLASWRFQIFGDDWFLPSNIGVSCKLSHHPVLWYGWFKGKFTGKPHISWENLWCPVSIFP